MAALSTRVLLAVALLLAGCGNGAGPDADVASETSTTTQTTQPILGAQATCGEFADAELEASLNAARAGLVVVMQANNVTRHPTQSEVERFHTAVMVKCAEERPQLMRRAMADAVLADPGLIPY